MRTLTAPSSSPRSGRSWPPSSASPSSPAPSPPPCSRPAAVHGNELGGLSASVDGYTLRAVEPRVDPGEDVFVEFSHHRSRRPDRARAGLISTARHLHLFAVRARPHRLPAHHPGPRTRDVVVAGAQPDPGPWHVIVELQPAALGREITLATDFDVPGEYRAEPLPPRRMRRWSTALTVRRSGALTTRSGSRQYLSDHRRRSAGHRSAAGPRCARPRGDHPTGRPGLPAPARRAHRCERTAARVRGRGAGAGDATGCSWSSFAMTSGTSPRTRSR